MNTNRLIRGLVGSYTTLPGSLHPHTPAVTRKLPVTELETRLRACVVGTPDGPCALQALLLALLEHPDLLNLVQDKATWRVAYFDGPTDEVQGCDAIVTRAWPDWGKPVGAKALSIFRTGETCTIRQGEHSVQGRCQVGAAQMDVSSPVFSCTFSRGTDAFPVEITLPSAWAVYPYVKVKQEILGTRDLRACVFDRTGEIIQDDTDPRRVTAAAAMALALLTLETWGY